MHVLLVGSRRNCRWGLPKGNLDDGEAFHVAAAREAFEEACVRGPASDEIVGSFLYSKNSSPHRYRVIVHALEAASVAGHDGLDGLRTCFYAPLMGLSHGACLFETTTWIRHCACLKRSRSRGHPARNAVARAFRKAVGEARPRKGRRRAPYAQAGTKEARERDWHWPSQEFQTVPLAVARRQNGSQQS